MTEFPTMYNCNSDWAYWPLFSLASEIFDVMEDGSILLSENLQNISQPSYSVNLTVRVSDYGNPPLSDEAVIVFTIRPPVTNPPEFLPSSCDGGVPVDEVII